MRTETITCDLCGEIDEHYTTEKKRIEGYEYDVHRECWTDFMARLSGKGRKFDALRSLYAPAVPARPENVNYPTVEQRYSPIQRIKAYAAEIRALTEKMNGGSK